MKRALLIAGGTVGGLGAVMYVTPPQLGSDLIATLAGASAATSDNLQSAAAQPSTGASATSSSNSNNSKNNSSNNAVTDTASPTPNNAKPAGASESFTGDAYNVGYGIVQVKISVSNGNITDAVALQFPNGRSQRFSEYAIPNLRSQTLAAQSAAIRGVSGASYTSYGWYKSLISALQKAGMNTGV